MEATTASLSLHSLRQLYLRHADGHYRRRSGEPTGTTDNVRVVLDSFVRFAGEACPASRVNKLMVRAWVDQLAADDRLTRRTVNDYLGRLRTWIKWAAAWDHIPVSVAEDLRLVRPLMPFRTRARESNRPAPPTLDDVLKVAAFMPPLARDVLRLIKLTGSRPSELLALRNREVVIDDDGPRLVPVQHKSAHFGHSRLIPLSAEALAILEPYRHPMMPDAPVFITPRARSGHYQIRSFRATIRRACKRAGVRVFTPYEVRHAVARHIRRLRGLDAAQAVLGHASSRTTEIYAPLTAGDQRTLEAARRGLEVL